MRTNGTVQYIILYYITILLDGFHFSSKSNLILIQMHVTSDVGVMDNGEIVVVASAPTSKVKKYSSSDTKQQWQLGVIRSDDNTKFFHTRELVTQVTVVVYRIVLLIRDLRIFGY